MRPCLLLVATVSRVAAGDHDNRWWWEHGIFITIFSSLAILLCCCCCILPWYFDRKNNAQTEPNTAAEGPAEEEPNTAAEGLAALQRQHQGVGQASQPPMPEVMAVIATVPGGQPMQFETADGRVMTVMVPMGVQPGMEFEFQVAAPEPPVMARPPVA